MMTVCVSNLMLQQLNAPVMPRDTRPEENEGQEQDFQELLECDAAPDEMRHVNSRDKDETADAADEERSSDAATPRHPQDIGLLLQDVLRTSAGKVPVQRKDHPQQLIQPADGMVQETDASGQLLQAAVEPEAGTARAKSDVSALTGVARVNKTDASAEKMINTDMVPVSPADPAGAAAGRAGAAKLPEVGDKILIETTPAGLAQENRIKGAEIIHERKSGDMHILQLRLLPDGLGTVRARILMTEGGLHVHLQAAEHETARLLQSDHQILVRILESVNDYGKIRVTVVERAAQVAQAGSATTPRDDQGFSGSGFAGQDARADSQASGYNRQGERRFSGQPQKDFLPEESQPDDLKGDGGASRYPRYLVI